EALNARMRLVDTGYMMRYPSKPLLSARGLPAARALTIVECLLAGLVLTIVALSMGMVISCGGYRFTYSDTSLRGVRLAEHLLEEIVARPYTGTGTSRATWTISDYNGFSDGPNNVADFTGSLYGTTDQVFRRTVTVTSSTTTVPGLGGLVMPGKLVTVHID